MSTIEAVDAQLENVQQVKVNLVNKLSSSFI